MVKMVFCVKRLPGMSEADFSKYWLNEHGALIKRIAPDMGIKQYV